MNRVIDITGVQLDVIPRVVGLYRVVEQFVERATGRKCPEIVKKGIVDLPYLAGIQIVLVNSRRQKTAEVTLRIDWEKHRIFGAGAATGSFEIDSSLSISGQISKVLERLGTSIRDVREKGNFTAEVWYIPRSDGTVKRVDACSKLGLETGVSKQLDWAEGKYIHIVYRGVRLGELQVDYKAPVV